MSPRTGYRNRCDQCFMRQVLCVCAEAPKIALKTRVTVLMHWREEKTTSNTGRIARLALTHSEIRVRGGKDRPLETEGLFSADFTPLLLYPSEGAVELTSSLVASLGRPVHLIVPDGTWRQARKVALRERAFSGLPRVKLPRGRPSSYLLRQSPHEENISTLEAIARALEIIEGGREGTEVRARLETLFELVVERILWSRGKLQLNECRTGIPQAALDAFHKDGCRGSLPV